MAAKRTTTNTTASSDVVDTATLVASLRVNIDAADAILAEQAAKVAQDFPTLITTTLLVGRDVAPLLTLKRGKADAKFPDRAHSFVSLAKWLGMGGRNVKVGHGKLNIAHRLFVKFGATDATDATSTVGKAVDAFVKRQTRNGKKVGLAEFVKAVLPRTKPAPDVAKMTVKVNEAVTLAGINLDTRTVVSVENIGKAVTAWLARAAFYAEHPELPEAKAFVASQKAIEKAAAEAIANAGAPKRTRKAKA